MKTIIIIAAAALLSGCTYTSVQLPGNGGTFHRLSLLNNQTVGNVTVKTTGPDAGVKIDAYGSNQTDIIGAAVAAAVKAGKLP